MILAILKYLLFSVFVVVCILAAVFGWVSGRERYEEEEEGK